MLEAELVVSRSRSRRLMFGGAILVGTIVVLIALQFTTGVAYAQSAEPKIIRADEVRAHRFIVEDHHDGTQGVEEAIFGMIQDAPGLRLGASDNPQISLSTHSGSYLYLADETGNPRVLMQVVGDRSSISLFNKNRMDLLDIALAWDSPSLTLTNENGKVVWKTP